jgi:hypothetical protein
MPPSGISQKLKKHLGFFRGVFLYLEQIKEEIYDLQIFVFEFFYHVGS